MVSSKVRASLLLGRKINGIIKPPKVRPSNSFPPPPPWDNKSQAILSPVKQSLGNFRGEIFKDTEMSFLSPPPQQPLYPLLVVAPGFP